MEIKFWTFLFLFPFFNNVSTFDCDKINNCLCLTEPDLELQCPTEDEDFIIHIKENEEILIDCAPGLDNFRIHHLPNMSIHLVNFRMRFCPLPQKPFKKILERFSLTSIRSLEFSVSNSQNLTISARHFTGLEHLKELKMNENGIMNLDLNVFTNFLNLTSLQLQGNNFLTLKPVLFRSLQQLTFLDLSGNNLTELEPNTFQVLKSLRILHLWDNKLSNLDDYTFSGLYNLESLELSTNKIENISENAFRQLKHLKRINLSANRIKTMPGNVFTSSRKLRMVLIRYNLHLKLPDYLFANLSLVQVDLANCHLRTVPEHIFENTQSLKIIKLEKNFIKELPKGLFKRLYHLEQLDLQNNLIESVSNVFDGLSRLKALHLQHNLISELDEDVFADLENLERINLRGNRIAQIGNQLQHSKNLKIVNLAHNNVEDMVKLDGATNLQHLDLSHNNIAAVKLKDLQLMSKVLVNFDTNQITLVDFQNVDLNTISATISLSNNPINCDCRNYDLIVFLKNRKEETLAISKKKLKCANPPELRNLSVVSAPLSVTCRDDTQCPEKCTCSWRPLDSSRIINCTGQNLTQFPRFAKNQTLFQFNQTELHLADNNLIEGPENLPEYDNVTKLYLAKNDIQKLTWLPPKIQVLELDYNRLKGLEPHLVAQLYTLESVNLGNNPWVCDCGSEALAEFLVETNDSVRTNNVYCSNFDSPLVHLKRKDLCSKLLLYYVILVALTLLLTLTILVTLYYRHQEKIKIWLFAKKLCLWFINEEKLDSDKTYDAFISYSHKDEDFVTGKLLPILENGPCPYKLCLHYRNWVPGEFITTQITNSVLKSRRTLIILSQNFLDSIWGKMEFRTAHTQAMSEGRARVILVLYGGVDVSCVDQEMKKYLETHTYVRWGDPHFWSKLACALPKRKSGHLLEDESKLIQSAPSSPGSTPPVLATRTDPLEFVQSEVRPFV